MIRIGLTGSIGMGKSTVGAMFAELGAAIWDADAAVHRLYARGGQAVKKVADRFPGAIVDGVVDRAKLSSLVVGKADALKDLEQIVHPLVAADRFATHEMAENSGVPAIVLDIPLLFETGGNHWCDVVVVVSAPAEVQRQRVLQRADMTEEKFEAILAKQMSDTEKRAKADHIIPTGGTLDETRAAVEDVWREIISGSEDASR